MSPECSGTTDSLFSARCEAFRRKDVAALVEMLEPDYQLWLPGASALGVADVRRVLEADFAAYDITPSYEREESIVSGEWAFERGWDVQRRVPLRGGEPAIRRQRIFLVLRRHPNGEWRFARGMAHPGPGA
jgi:ketosteroid isomerase-like protein